MIGEYVGIGTNALTAPVRSPYVSPERSAYSTWLVVSDFDYCSRCYAAQWEEHCGGKHRFVLLRYSTPNMIIERVVAPLKKKIGDSDPWKIRKGPVTDAAALQEGDEGAVYGVVAAGMPYTLVSV